MGSNLHGLDASPHFVRAYDAEAISSECQTISGCWARMTQQAHQGASFVVPVPPSRDVMRAPSGFF